MYPFSNINFLIFLTFTYATQKYHMKPIKLLILLASFTVSYFLYHKRLPNWDELTTAIPAETSSALPPKKYWPGEQGTSQILEKANFVVGYSKKHHQALWTMHVLKGSYVRGEASREGNQFQPDPEVRGRTPLPSDYSRSGYDRGHLVPAGDFKCCQSWMNETFYMSNISPQNPEFNRGTWERLESLIRQWARRDKELFVITGSIFDKNPTKIGRRVQISVPAYHYKILVFKPEDPTNSRMIGFILPNQETGHRRFRQYATSVREIEEKTGIDFFAQMPKAWQDKLEKQDQWINWAN